MHARTARMLLAAAGAVALAAMGLPSGAARAAGQAAEHGEHMGEEPAEHGERMGEHHEEGEVLPETFHFLQLGWWVVHIIAIPLVGFIGYTMGKKAGGGQPSQA
ncbi:MAG: hypothetical protein ACLF0G_11505 [Candidatus Brocadiia bacterium]